MACNRLIAVTQIIIATIGLSFYGYGVRAQSTAISFKFDFGASKPKPGHKQVLPATIYDKTTGYGFEPGSTVTCNPQGARSSCGSDQPFFFSVVLPEGNYKVTVTFGNSHSSTVTTVKAELRRLMLEEVRTAPGKFETRSFVVNVRTPLFPGGEVKLKDREKTTEWWAWDEKLTLEFNNRHPAVSTIEIERVPDLPTIFLLGDSTVCDQPLEPYNSWGQMLTRFFKPTVAIANHAESGESLKSSLSARRLEKVLSLLKPGDYLFIQYGHNDMKEKGEGVGAFTSYKASLRQFIAETRKRGGIPVLITSMHRRTFDSNGKITNSLLDYPEAARQTAKEEKVALIDLNEITKTLYESLGTEGSGVAFKEGDGTHHNSYGSYELAKCVVEGIKAAKLAIAKHLVTNVPSFDPARPDKAENFAIPASPQRTAVKPDGN